MIVRSIDVNNDWLFGKGKNDYQSGNAAVAQSIKTRCQSFLNDCFFAADQGIDWWNLLGSKNQIQLNLAINLTILNTENVTAILQLSLNLSASRNLTVVYRVQTSYSQLTGNFTYQVGTLSGFTYQGAANA